MEPVQADMSRVSILSEAITDSRLQEIYLDCVAKVSSLHEEVTHSVTDLEVRFFFRGALLVRIVPYRELLHVHVGDNPGWEVRIREEEGYLETLDLILNQFLRIFSGRPASAR